MATSAIDSELRAGDDSAPADRETIGKGPKSVGAESAKSSSATERTLDTAEKAADERSRLLTAAMEVLHRSGWWGFKVESVLRQAGLSTRSFYRHFEKKSDLLLALLEFELGSAAVNFQRVTGAAGTPSDKVRAFVTATVDMAYRADLAKPSSLFASHWRELLPEYPMAIERCTQRMMAPLIEAVAEGQARGEFQSDDPVADARAIFYLVAGMAADQAALGTAIPREEFEHIVMPFITRAIGLR